MQVSAVADVVAAAKQRFFKQLAVQHDVEPALFPQRCRKRWLS
jgi:hypothetical protein